MLVPSKKMLLLLILLLQWRVTTCTSSPTLEDNMIPTDEEVISELINSYRGQPEQEIALNLPSDEEAFNEIKPILQSGDPLYYLSGIGAHYISSSFPEIDARGFHESVFDDLDDFYPISQRSKKYDSSLPINARGFYGDIFTDGFGSFHPVKRHYQNAVIGLPATPTFSISRQKRSSPNPKISTRSSKTGEWRDRYTQSPIEITEYESGGPNNCGGRNCSNPRLKSTVKDEDPSVWRLLNFDHKSHPFNFTSSKRYDNFTEAVDGRYKRNAFNENHQKIWNPLLFRFHDEATAKRRPEVDSTGFHNDVFDNLGELDKLRKRGTEMNSRDARKRVPEIRKSAFHGDVLHEQFGKVDTVKRTPDMGKSGFHGDVFHKSFGNFETLRKRVPALDSRVFNGDAFNRDFGHFDTLRKRKRKPEATRTGFNDDAFDVEPGSFRLVKRRPQPALLNGDAFHSNFGNFETLRKRKPLDNGFDDGAFDYGQFNTVKRRPIASELHGDAFHNSFGNFDTMKRTLAGDAFHSQFGRFETMKRRPEMDSTGFNGDVFHGQFGSFDTLKRTPEESWNRFHRYNTDAGHLGAKFRNRGTLKTSESSYGEPQSYPEYYARAADEYEKFKNFIRNYELTSKFADFRSRMRMNETALPDDFKRTDSSK